MPFAKLQGEKIDYRKWFDCAKCVGYIICFFFIGCKLFFVECNINIQRIALAHILFEIELHLILIFFFIMRDLICIITVHFNYLVSSRFTPIAHQGRKSSLFLNSISRRLFHCRPQQLLHIPHIPCRLVLADVQLIVRFPPRLLLIYTNETLRLLWICTAWCRFLKYVYFVCCWMSTLNTME